MDTHSEIISETARLLGDGIVALRAREHVPTFRTEKERYDWFVVSHESTREGVDQCISHWIDHQCFESHVDPDFTAMAFWRLVGADDQLPFAGEPILSDPPRPVTDPAGLLRILLLDFWLPESSYPSKLFSHLARGERMFH